MNAMSTPTRFSQEVFDTICERIANGESLNAICKDPHMPAQGNFYAWLTKDETGELQEKYARAREAQGDVYFDAVGDIGMRTLEGGYDPQAARVAIDALKWSAGKLRPKKYGDKVLNETDITLRRIDRVETVLIAPPEREVIDVTPEEGDE